eukprot:1141018-Pelagomonas_calceolata.AAC.4
MGCTHNAQTPIGRQESGPASVHKLRSNIDCLAQHAGKQGSAPAAAAAAVAAAVHHHPKISTHRVQHRMLVDRRMPQQQPHVFVVIQIARPADLLPQLGRLMSEGPEHPGRRFVLLNEGSEACRPHAPISMYGHKYIHALAKEACRPQARIRPPIVQDEQYGEVPERKGLQQFMDSIGKEALNLSVLDN